MKVGRFELRSVLGEGAQAIVWLAFDARLEREVAVKLMRPDAAADADTVSLWLQEARSVSRLTHPHIVPVFEADMHERQPYLVFEYVPGMTLTQQLKTRGAMPAHQGVATMLGVLDALAAAHAGGIVHRDLKPSNILIDTAGRARVMDFGIAARLHDPGVLDQVVGTPGYMSPEAVDGGLPTAALDVFSAGVVLTEMLSGERLVKERNAFRAMHQVASVDLQLPEGLPSAVDDDLRRVLLRALARDPSQRWPTAAAFRDALKAWATPEPATAEASGGSGALDFLLRRMRHKSDFPALSNSVARIQRVANSENESLASLSSEILKDVALTNKLLRMVNTARFSSAGGNISTVSRAVAVVGFGGIRDMALSLVLVEHMQDKSHATQLKEEFLRALMAGMLAGDLALQTGAGEEAFLGAMFQNLGRMLTEFYFVEEARQVRGMVAAAAGQGGTAALVSEETASAEVLGLSYEALGLGVAKAWGLPPRLQSCMMRPKGEVPTRELRDAGERLSWLSQAANQITEALLNAPPELAAARVSGVAHRYARAVGVSAERIEAASAAAQLRLAQMAQAMNLQVAAHSPAQRLFAVPKTDVMGAGEASAATLVLDARAGDDALAEHALQATVVLAPEPASPRAALENAAEILAAGIQDITNTMVENFKLNDVLRMILETMFRALGFRRIVFCLRDAKTQSLTGRFGLGEGAESVAAALKVPLTAASDLFTAVCIKGADTLITDATTAQMAARLPAWYRTQINAPAFLLLPMQMKGAPFALIYADKAVPGGIALGDKELSLLRTLRNQAVMAFKQIG